VLTFDIFTHFSHTIWKTQQYWVQGIHYCLVSDESTLEECLRRCAIQIDDFYLLLIIFEIQLSIKKHNKNYPVGNNYFDLGLQLQQRTWITCKPG